MTDSQYDPGWVIVPPTSWRDPRLKHLECRRTPMSTEYRARIDPPFTGDEPEPEAHTECRWRQGMTDQELAEFECGQDELRVLSHAWRDARVDQRIRQFNLELAQILTAGPGAAALWQNWQRAVASLQETYGQFERPGADWQHLAFVLNDAKSAASAALSAWQERAEQIARADHDLLRYIGESRHCILDSVGAAAEAVGVDVTGWDWGCLYRDGGGTVHDLDVERELRRLIEAGDRRLAEARAVATGHRR